MNVNFDALDKIPTMIKLLEKVLENQENLVDKPWLSTKEAAEYLGFSKDHIDAKVKRGEFIEGIHYHKVDSKRIFEKAILDKWVIGMDKVDLYANANANINTTINNIVEQFSA